MKGGPAQLLRMQNLLKIVDNFCAVRRATQLWHKGGSVLWLRLLVASLAPRRRLLSHRQLTYDLW
jgi:hypothetical protein